MPGGANFSGRGQEITRSETRLKMENSRPASCDHPTVSWLFTKIGATQTSRHSLSSELRGPYQ